MCVDNNLLCLVCLLLVFVGALCISVMSKSVCIPWEMGIEKVVRIYSCIITQCFSSHGRRLRNLNITCNLVFMRVNVCFCLGSLLC